MIYRDDADLEFLSQINSAELSDLVHCLTHGRNGAIRWTEELTTSEFYKQYYPDHQKYWQLIAAEIQCFGANTFATLLRGGKGVQYKKILRSVCKKMKVKYDKRANIEQIEESLLMKVLADTFEKMSAAELKELARVSGVRVTNKTTMRAMVSVFRAVYRIGGVGSSYQPTFMIINRAAEALIGRGFMLVGNTALTRVMAILTGPVGWIITILWTAICIAGAAHRVTVPAVIHVAALRQKYLHEQRIQETTIVEAVLACPQLPASPDPYLQTDVTV